MPATLDRSEETGTHVFKCAAHQVIINSIRLFIAASNYTTAATVNIDVCVMSALIIVVIYDTSQKNTAIQTWIC